MSDVTIYRKKEGREEEKHEIGVHEVANYFDLKSRNKKLRLVSKHLIPWSSVNLPVFPSAASIVVQASQTS